MSSVDWAKFQKGQSKAILMHCDGDERVCRSHSNVHIDTSKTYQNIALGLCAQREVLYKTFDDIVTKCNEKQVAESGKSIRKDQVRLIGLSITVPKDLPEEKYEDWFRDTYEVLCKTYGKRVLGADCHFDEVHEYTDVRSGEKVESRPHMHAFVVPEVDGKLNGKAFVTRKAMTSINNTLQEMTQKSYGCDFMDGTKKKSLGDVETVKGLSSVKAVMLESQNDGFNKGYNDGLEAARKDAEEDAEKIRNDAREEIDEAKKNNEVLSKTLQERESAISQKEDDLDLREIRTTQKESFLEDKSHEISARENAVHEKENAVSEMFKSCEAIKNGFESLKTEVVRMVPWSSIKESITILFDNCKNGVLKKSFSRYEQAQSRLGILKSDNQDENNQELDL